MNKKPLIIAASIVLLLTAMLGALKIYQTYQIPPETPKVTVTIPEGATVEYINKIFKESGILKDSQFGQEEEGYLFPDTYEFFLDSSIDVVRSRLNENFQTQIDEVLPQEGGNLDEIITMASIVEKEVPEYEDRQVVAGIILKRLRNGIPLQMDATLCYTKETPCHPITSEDKNIDSPYNTYKYKGLPPGPISNPGIEAIKATVNPRESNYLYYLSDPLTQRTIFASTLDEHNANVVKYLGN